MSKLIITPCTIKEANAYIELYHRHHKKLKVGYLFALAVSDEQGKIRGIAMIGRPTNQYMADGYTAEVRRVATDGCQNACSALYGAAWRACKAMGYRRLITYTLQTESGSSLRGAGWKVVAEVRGNQPWGHKRRPRVDTHPLEPKLRWEISVL